MWVVIRVDEHEDYDCEESQVITERVGAVVGPFDSKDQADRFEKDKTDEARRRGWCYSDWSVHPLTSADGNI